MKSGDETGVGVLLAAGSGSRFRGGQHKLLSSIEGTPIVSRSILALYRSENLKYKIVVQGCVDLSPFVPTGMNLLYNDCWRDGMGTSLHLGVSFAREVDADFIVVGLGDQPFVTSSCWSLLAAQRGSQLAMACYNGMRRNPVRIGRELFDELPRTGDEGARNLLRVMQDMVECIECEGSHYDIDTVEDLKRWR
ncbi:molybdenum cofactor cytidylyltransferase [Ferrithrix thermotolerans DSM 19514]|uniref:Molybdenum cofactor cytidylyltransferase n=1 Tax=Ferrithrix thermotolerans DSM 19514 TaxID=1121881 RepID=A0A1M4VPI3_9ACTN|nr:nucleotidyltransferase family protein [Ferrithrix thermotolerans]SHE70964.1 molybdenum cofactor cytidylyltransferase [Ferrithrix thermotolerans DSM 19514]